MKYKCIKSFCVSNFDDDGFITLGYLEIQEGTIWIADNSSARLIGGEIRLDNNETHEWLEVSQECINEHFELIED